MRFELLQALNAERSQRRACAVVTDLEGGEQRLVREADVAADPLHEPLARAFRSGRSGASEDGRTFVNVHLPPPRLVVIGAVHISQALAPMAVLDRDARILAAARLGGTRLIDNLAVPAAA